MTTAAKHLNSDSTPVQAGVPLRETSARSYAILFGALAVWSVTVIMIFVEVLGWPYSGAKFVADVPGQSAQVITIQEGSPAMAAGLAEGDRIVAIGYGEGNLYKMTGLEAITEGRQTYSYEMANQTVDAKSKAWEILNSGPLTLHLADDRKIKLIPENGRRIATLPVPVLNFMIQSLIVLMVATGILVFAPASLPVLLLVASGYGMGINMLLNMVAVSSELTMPDVVYTLRITLGLVALVTFAYALVALLWYFPRPLAKFPFGAVVFGAWIFTNAAQQFQFFEFPLHPFQGPYLLAMITAVVISIFSWRRTRDNPLERATVMWFVLSIAGVSGFVALFFSLPAALGYPPLINTNVALFALTLVYIGIALGTLRYRLFDIHRIWWRTITWATGGLVVLLMDIILMSQFNFEQATALPLALLLAGWVYFPIRQFFFEYFLSTRSPKIAEHVPTLIETFSGHIRPGDFEGRYLDFLRNVFRAQEIGDVGRHPLDGSVLEANGLALRVPDIAGSGSVQLVGKSSGRQLFSTEDKSVADSILRLVRYMAAASQRELERLDKNRQQIVRDLHDDVGGRLLSMIYKAPNKEFSASARDALGALKETLVVIEDAQTVDISAAWDRIRDEAVERFEQAAFMPDNSEQIASERELTVREYMNLRRILQEIVSNMIKYGKTGPVALSLSVAPDGEIRVETCNEIHAASEETHSTNRGISNIKTRLEEVGGRLEIDVEDHGDRAMLYRSRIILPMNDQQTSK